MTDTLWYAEASLSSNEHVFCAGSLAQCVRKWTRLPEGQQRAAQIHIGGKTGASQIVDAAAIALLAQKPELTRV